MSTLLVRRLKSSRAHPVLIRDGETIMTVDFQVEVEAASKAVNLDTWSSCDCEEECSASSSDSTSSASSSTSSIFFEDMDDLSLPSSPDTSARSGFTKSSDSASAICCPACDVESDAEESWQEHVYLRDTTASARLHRDSVRRPKLTSRSRRSSSSSISPPVSSNFRPSARSSRRKQVPSSSPPSSSSSDEDEELQHQSKSRSRRSQQLADCECDPSACPPSPHPQAIELCPIVEARLRTTVNPRFYLIYCLENVMMKERKIRYPLKDRATHLSFGTCRGTLGSSPLRAELHSRF